MTTISTLPAAPDPNVDDAATFSAKATAFTQAMPAFVTQTNAVASETNAASNAAAAVVNATKWAGTTTSYTNGQAVYSGVNYLTYRLKTASLAANVANTDPSTDTTNWTQVASTGNVTANSSAILTLGAGTVAAPTYSFTGRVTDGMWSPAAGVVAWSTLGSERLRIDSVGSIGYEVVPSTSTAPFWQLVAGTVIATKGDQISLCNNLYYNAAWKYASTAAGSQFLMTGGTFSWLRTPSGTVDTTATLTLSMYLDANGNLGLNTGAPAYKLDINGTLGVGGAVTFLSNCTVGGNVLINSTGALGYTTGSGGSVTQATSRTTGVTLNKTNGAITLFSTTTTAGQVTTFTVTNSTVAATDTIIVNQKTGGGIYLCSVTTVAAGSFNISVHTPAAQGAEAPTLNFAVIKAVIA